MDPQSAFADALARARQIAAKINQPGAGGDEGGLKRAFDGQSDGQPEVKKFASDSSFGMQNMSDQSRAQAVQAAASAAAQINAKLGIQSTGGPPQMPTSHGGGGGMGMVTTENFSVPDRMVGLVIGKGGEQIANIQAETGVKVQFAPDSGGRPERPCTLTGPPDSIEAAKGMIMRIIERGQGGPDPAALAQGHTMIEVLIPGNKVGLIIGKGGETIKHLQERAAVKMVMIQESNIPTHHDKPLRITGEPQKCEQAKSMVFDLLAQKESEGGFGEFGGGRGSHEIRVPRTSVGVVIGKGGEMIRKIQAETGARVQFLPDDGAPDRVCSITGPQDKVQEAANMVQELVNDSMNRGMGRGRGRGGDNFRDGPGRGGRFGANGDFQDETRYNIPAEKCGLVIGKGGETIKEINRVSGAFVELARQPGPNPNERTFVVRGIPEQIHHAIEMICEKAGLPTPQGPPGGGGPGGPGGPPPGQGPPPGGPSGPPPTAYPGYNYQQNYGQNQGPGPGQQPSYAPQGWGNAYQQWQQGNPNDPNKAAADANAAAWQAYFQQYYNQGGSSQGSQPPAQNTSQPQQQTQQPQPTVNPTTGQPDYSQAWADYYRQQGMHYHADAILAQARAGQNQGPPQGQPSQYQGGYQGGAPQQ